MGHDIFFLLYAFPSVIFCLFVCLFLLYAFPSVIVYPNALSVQALTIAGLSTVSL